MSGRRRATSARRCSFYVVYDCGTPHPRLLRVQDLFGKLVVQAKGGVRIDETAIFGAAEGDRNISMAEVNG